MVALRAKENEVGENPALQLLPYALYVVTTRRGEEVNGFAGNWLAQASFQPTLVMIAVRRGNRSNAMIRESGVFCVNLLSRDQGKLAEHFMQPSVTPRGTPRHKLQKVPYYGGKSGCPVLRDALAYFECRVTDVVDRGDHTVFVAEVISGEVLRDGEPLTMANAGWLYGG